VKHDFNEIELAFNFVSSNQPETNYAILNLETGDIYYKSDMIDEEEFPEDIEESDDYIWIPHKNDLDLGKELVFAFARECIPEQFNEIKGFFRHKGAYANLKNLLRRIGKLKEWETFENDAMIKALKEWCCENEIEIE
jgi:hypothetical protein